MYVFFQRKVFGGTQRASKMMPEKVVREIGERLPELNERGQGGRRCSGRGMEEVGGS